jgi:hypothetical protein
VTVRKYADGWVQGYPEDSTRGEKIRAQLAGHILPKLGGATLAELERRPSKVQQFLTLPMGPAGASQIAITLSTMLNAAVDDQLIGRNPCNAGSVRIPRQPKRKITPWTPGQVERIRAGLPGQYRAIVDCGSGLGVGLCGPSVGPCGPSVGPCGPATQCIPGRGPLHPTNGSRSLSWRARPFILAGPSVQDSARPGRHSGGSAPSAPGASSPAA